MVGSMWVHTPVKSESASRCSEQELIPAGERTSGDYSTRTYSGDLVHDHATAGRRNHPGVP